MEGEALQYEAAGSAEIHHPITDDQPLKRSSSLVFLPPNMSELRVVLLGSSWSERSSAGNFILGENMFYQEPESCLRISGTFNNKTVSVINTPDLLLPNISEDELREHVGTCERLSAPGPHVFLLLLQPEDFTEEHRQRLCRVLELFSDRSFDHSLVLISTPREESSAENYMKRPPLKELIKKCRYRYLKRRDIDRSELLTRLGQIVKENNGEHLRCGGSEDSGLTMRGTNRPSLNLVLFGIRGSGKTSAAKAILGQTELHSVSTSSKCVQNQGEVCGRWVSLVELPALCRKPQEAVMEESFRCMSLCDPEGVHAFILVLPVGPLTDEDKGELEIIQNTFSSRVNDFTMILFTVESDPNHPDVVNFLKENQTFREICQSCRGSYFVLNIKNKRQIPELLETVEQMRLTKDKPDSYTIYTFARSQMEMISSLEAERLQTKGAAKIRRLGKNLKRELHSVSDSVSRMSEILSLPDFSEPSVKSSSSWGYQPPSKLAPQLPSKVPDPPLKSSSTESQPRDRAALRSRLMDRVSRSSVERSRPNFSNPSVESSSSYEYQPPSSLRRSSRKRRSSLEYLPPSMSDLRVVLLGNSCSERSSVGNLILGENKFNTEEEPDHCVRVSGVIKGKVIDVIKLPDLLLPNISEDKLREHVGTCERLSAPGPHVFLLLLQPEDFTEGHRQRLCRVLELFSDRSFDHSLVLISTPREEQPGFMEKYQQHPPIEKMIKMCGDRVLWLKDLHIEELLTRFEQIVKENNGGHVSGDPLKKNKGNWMGSLSALNDWYSNQLMARNPRFKD